VRRVGDPAQTGVELARPRRFMIPPVYRRDVKRAGFHDPAGSVRIGEWIDGTITAAGREYADDDVDVLAPTNPDKVLGIGPNYRSNVEEPPERQRLFRKGGANVVAGHGDTVTLPESSEVVFEAELGVVVGEQCRNLGVGDAMDAVAGFTCVDDLSNQNGRRGHVPPPQVVRQRGADGPGPRRPGGRAGGTAGPAVGGRGEAPGLP